MSEQIRMLARRYAVSMPVAELGFFLVLIGALALVG